MQRFNGPSIFLPPAQVGLARGAGLVDAADEGFVRGGGHRRGTLLDLAHDGAQRRGVAVQCLFVLGLRRLDHQAFLHPRPHGVASRRGRRRARRYRCGYVTRSARDIGACWSPLDYAPAAVTRFAGGWAWLEAGSVPVKTAPPSRLLAAVRSPP